MGKQVWCGLLVVVFGMQLGLSQSFLDDQFQLFLPGLTVGVFLEGNTDCNAVVGQGFTSFACATIVVNAFWGGGTDAVGNFYQINRHTIPLTEPLCPAQVTGTAVVFDIERVTPAGLQLVARVPECVFLATGENRPAQITALRNLAVDSVTGNLYVAVDSRSDRLGLFSLGIARISGLPTLLDIIPTFQPASETLSWVTPKHPEALPAADRFMVYAGDVADLRSDHDFTRAVPVDCSVPDADAPQPGDLLTVVAPLQPAAGEAFYALVGVEYAGQRRFGRQNIGGVLSGRQPMEFRACN